MWGPMTKFLVLIILLVQATSTFALDPDSALDPAKLSNPFDGQNNIYQKIFEELNAEYVHIGKRQRKEFCSIISFQ